MGRNLIRFPSALPAIMLPLLFRSQQEISLDDVEVLKSAVFTSDIMNNTKVDSTPFLLTFRGTPCTSVQSTYETALRRIALVPGMQDRIRLFLLPEYRALTDTSSVSVEKYSGTKFEVIFTVVPKNAVPRDQGWGEYAFASLLVIGSLLTTFIYSTDVNSMNQQFVQSALDGDISVVGKVVPLALGIVGLQFVHDLGHYIFALLNKVKLSIPFFIPSLQIGLFGTITNFLSYPKSRKQLFDVSIAGPLFGFAASLACTIYGLDLTIDTAPDLLTNYPALPQGFFSSSLFLYELVNYFLDIASKDPTALVYVHPAVAVGITGLLVNALNFIPIGRLDGGRVTMAIAGRQSANGIALAALIGQAVSVLTNSSPVNFFWSLVVVFLQRGADYPPEDDVTPISTDDEDANKSVAWFGRLSALVFCVALTTLILLPVPIDPSITPGLNPLEGSGGNFIQRL
jgi:Zn-dependent protease